VVVAARGGDVGDEVSVGDVTATVTGVAEVDGLLTVAVVIGGVDDGDGIDSFRLITGDRRLEPVAAPADERCDSITVAPRTCTIDFDVSAADGSSRVLVLRRGDDQRNWVLTES